MPAGLGRALSLGRLPGKWAELEVSRGLGFRVYQGLVGVTAYGLVSGFRRV